MELQNLRAQLVSLESERERISQQGLDTSFQDATIREVKAHIADLESQQNIEERVVQAKETGYYFDTLTTSSGASMIELSYSPENHELQAIAVQKGFLAQEDAFNAKINELQYRNDSQTKIIENANITIMQLNENADALQADLNQANSEKSDAFQKLANAANIIAEKDAEIKRLTDLKVNIDSVPIAPLSEEEKESKLMAEVMGKQIKVINVRPKFDTFDNKIFIAVNVITGVEFEDYYIYLCKKDEDKQSRYKEISPELADILREEYATKKAELEAQNTVIPVMEPPNVVVEELVEDAEPGPIEEELRAAAATMVEGSPSSDREVQAEEVEVITLESLHARLSQVERSIYGNQKGLVA